MRTVNAKTRSSIGFLTSAQVASALGITKRTLHNWIKAGKITASEMNPDNGYYRWTLADVEAIRNTLREQP